MQNLLDATWREVGAAVSDLQHLLLLSWLDLHLHWAPVPLVPLAPVVGAAGLRSTSPAQAAA
jgi:hypothetical protein